MLDSSVGRSVTLIVLLCLGQAVQSAPIQNKFEFTAGLSQMRFNSSIVIDSKDGSVQKEISMEDDLAFDSELKFAWLGVNWRFADVHRLAVTYLPMRRTSSIVSNKDRSITSGDITRTIKAGSSIDSVFSPNVLDVNYIYSFYQDPALEMSVSFGLYWVLHSSSIEAHGRIEVDGEEGRVIEENFTTAQSLQAPLPLFGFQVEYGFYDRWQLKGQIRYIAAKIGTIDSSIFNFTAGVEYDVLDELGVGIGVSSFDLSIESERLAFNNALKMNYHGGLLYLKYQY